MSISSNFLLTNAADGKSLYVLVKVVFEEARQAEDDREDDDANDL